jgi:regulation of enolase protein 1 (concanavalin A-like superfamily)
METQENLVKAANSKGYQFELYTDHRDKTTYFGFTTGNNIWYWYRGHNYTTFKVEGPVSFIFDHAYYQNSGKILSTDKRWLKAEKLLGIW